MAHEEEKNPGEKALGEGPSENLPEKGELPKQGRRPPKKARARKRPKPRENRRSEPKPRLPEGPPLIAEAVFRDDLPGIHVEVTGVPVKPGDYVIIELGERKEVAKIVSPPVLLPLKQGLLPQVKRFASPKEVSRYKENLEFEDKAWDICENLARELGLEMKLVRVERLFDRSKVIFYYTADGRIDFRQLVKDLVRALRTRIEMRQIGVRHEAGMLGGIGSCGREICCSLFLKKFDPVSIRIAKEQSLPLDPTKISGICGRLLCCLLYEYDAYAELSASLPKIGKRVSTSLVEGRIVRYNIFRQSVTVETPQGQEVEVSVEDFRKELKK